VSLRPGESQTFALCTPLAFERLTASPAELWPPNHKLVPVTITPTPASACGTTTWEIVSVTSNEAVDGLGSGDTSPDWEIESGLSLKLRAERAGTGSDRVYTVTVRGTDEGSNTATRSVTVTVPHDR
jgi:hypothetical protein